MDIKKAKAMVRRMNKEYGREVATLYENYSGRGMFGAMTTGVVVVRGAEPKGFKKHYHYDAMGLDTILY